MPGSEEFLDPYLDSETGILRNLIGARTKESLEDAEGSLSFTRLVQLGAQQALDAAVHIGWQGHRGESAGFHRSGGMRCATLPTSPLRN
jgi:hypothetical protein